MDEREAWERLAAARVGRLATVRPDGRPHVVPFVFAIEGRTIYWAVDAKPKSTLRLQRLANIAAHPEVEVVVDAYEDGDWNRLWWVRASGGALVVEDAAEHGRALGLLSAKYEPYARNAPVGEVVAIRVSKVTWWEASRG